MKRFICAAALALMPVNSASAHFLLEYSDATLIERPGDVPVHLIFWHPMSNGLVMDLDRPQEFFALHNGERIDLLDTLTETTFQGAENSARALRGSVPVKRSGDYVIVTVPQPFYEEAEDIYIQQFTKSYLNRNGLPTDWVQPVGLPVEIMPLVKPYNVVAGSTFTGQVLREGEPAAGIEVEVEFMAAEPDTTTGTAKPATIAPPPGGSIVVLTDANGTFTFGIPRAGHWGFAALKAGPVTEHDGKPLSQDAVIWIRAWDLE